MGALTLGKTTSVSLQIVLRQVGGGVVTEILHCSRQHSCRNLTQAASGMYSVGKGIVPILPKTQNSGGNVEKKLYRSRTDRKLLGVCGGLANYWNIDPTVVRVIAVASILFGTLGIWIYIILALVVPAESS